MKARVKTTKARKSIAASKKVELSSGNVFADLGFQDSEERLLKAKLATKIAQLIEKKGWTQAQTDGFGPTKGISCFARRAFWFFKT